MPAVSGAYRDTPGGVFCGEIGKRPEYLHREDEAEDRFCRRQGSLRYEASDKRAAVCPYRVSYRP